MKATVKDTFKQDVLDSKKIILVDVWASWCAPCRSMEPVLESLEQDVKEWAEIVKLDAEAEMDLVQELGVSSLPTFLVYKGGNIVESTVGATSKANLLNLLQQAKQ
ncbi:MAG TPA: thioredoxin [Candidatus Saccharimonadales bacterium]|nr:thioredoxin [Candidatus Saccharimonadales bacterium]